MRQINTAGLRLIQDFEGLKLQAYMCPAGVPTIGWGHTETVTPECVRSGRTITSEQADELLRKDLHTFTTGVYKHLSMPATDNQFAAMVSLAYNIGLGAFARSSVLRAHNRGDTVAAAQAFGMWNQARDPATGKRRVLAGLTRRRAAEAALYLADDKGDMPHAVERQPAAASPVAQAGALAATAAVVSAGAQGAGWPIELALAAAVVAAIAGAVVVWRHFRDTG